MPTDTEKHTHNRWGVIIGERWGQIWLTEIAGYVIYSGTRSESVFRYFTERDLSSEYNSLRLYSNLVSPEFRARQVTTSFCVSPPVI